MATASLAVPDPNKQRFQIRPFLAAPACLCGGKALVATGEDGAFASLSSIAAE